MASTDNNEESVAPENAAATSTADKAVELCKKYNLKTDDSNVATAARASMSEEGEGNKKKDSKPRSPQGRMYSTEYANKPGGVRVDDMIFGVKMAHISCTDDSPERIQSSGPNTKEALKMIVGGSLEEAHKPLSTLLKDHFDLTMDKWIDETGVRYGRPVDTQGFIASNETTIVLSYRFTTSIFDWLTNLSMTTSEWEPDEDKLIGHAGVCSCCFGRSGKGRKPRVHTGFYNNFVTTCDEIDTYIIEKLKKPETSAKTVYVCGTSLGAAIATNAFCYLLLGIEWEKTPHKLVLVTAGSPRIANPHMAKVVNERINELKPLDKAVNCRLVYDQDVVPHVPMHIGGFIHLDKLIYITKDGDILVNPYIDEHKNFDELKAVMSSFRTAKNVTKKDKSAGKTNKGGKEDNEEEEEEKTEDEQQAEAFAKELETTALPVKCHMPYYYLTFLENLKKQQEEEDGL